MYFVVMDDQPTGDDGDEQKSCPDAVGGKVDGDVCHEQDENFYEATDEASGGVIHLGLLSHYFLLFNLSNNFTLTVISNACNALRCLYDNSLNHQKGRTGFASDSKEVPHNDNTGLWKENLRVSNEPRKGSNLPFSPPVSVTPQTHSKNSPQKKLISDKKQLKNAKKDRKSAVSIRSLVMGLIILIATSIAITAVISPSLLGKIASGDFAVKTETCTVTEINSSLFFDSTCGKFEWDSDRQPGTPATKLVEGETYSFSSKGLRIGPARVFPVITTFEKTVVTG